MGHCTIVFKGGNEPERPGCIMVEGDEALLAADIKVGITIEIH
ncbi:PTS glucitol/sorbitol transporter subunit IIA [Megasphaera massiliensis]